MSSHDWGHLAGRGTFDMAAFNLAGKALGIVTIGLQEARHAELILQCEHSLSQALGGIASQLNTVTTNFARKAAMATEPEVAIAGIDIKNSWQVLKQEAEQFVNHHGKKVAASGGIANNSALMQKFVAASKTTKELISKYGNEIKKITGLTHKQHEYLHPENYSAVLAKRHFSS
jgi:hypothetical protein